jgi:alkylation response protein AidB-like acyl-CoA dehydrogenase
MAAASYLEELTPVIDDVVAPHAAEVDAAGSFPRASMDALGKAGFLGLITASEVGGRGESVRAAAEVVEHLAQACGSTAMVVCMHYAGTAVIEAFGHREGARGDRRRWAFDHPGVLRNRLAQPFLGADVLSELRSGRAGGTQRPQELGRRSRLLRVVQPTPGGRRPEHPVAGARRHPGLEVTGRFDGFGLRGNASSPMSATDVTVPQTVMLGTDGKGDEIMLGVVLSYFHVMSAAILLGFMEAAIAKTIAHATKVRFEHPNSRLVDMPTTRTHIAKMRLAADQVRALFLDTVQAMETERADAPLRVLARSQGSRRGNCYLRHRPGHAGRRRRGLPQGNRPGTALPRRSGRHRHGPHQ